MKKNYLRDFINYSYSNDQKTKGDPFEKLYNLCTLKFMAMWGPLINKIFMMLKISKIAFLLTITITTNVSKYKQTYKKKYFQHWNQIPLVIPQNISNILSRLKVHDYIKH